MLPNGAFRVQMFQTDVFEVRVVYGNKSAIAFEGVPGIENGLIQIWIEMCPNEAHMEANLQ